MIDTYYRNNILEIPNATPVDTDAAQYMYRKGTKQFNLCGEFCVAHVLGLKNIDTFLDGWEAKDLKWYQQVFKNGLSRTTGVYDLEKMLSAWGILTPCNRFSSIPPLEYLSAQLVDQQAILGVQIDYTGYLVGKGIPHWIVLDRLTVMDKNHAIADVYNPFTNAIEPYSWKELMTSTGAYKNGIWIRRV